jgi:drug/metabolite transporter (DMT)-like permease
MSSTEQHTSQNAAASPQAAQAARRRATAIGFIAILLWALLAVLTARSGQVPPFQMTAMTFAIGAAVGFAWFGLQGRLPRVPRGRGGAVAAGIAGLFLYHALYFTALRNAPAVEASLIAYLWPLLIVVGSALLPGEKLKAHHVGGALIGLCGAGVILALRGGGLTGGGNLLGYGAAFACAFVWSGYSLLSRRFPDVPTDAVVWYCAATALLSLPCHWLLETTAWPATGGEWLAVAALGAGPVGVAFYTWDIGCKSGDIQVLGALSYLSPLMSTLVLIAAGVTAATFGILAACLLITLGALLAAKDLIATDFISRKGR